MKRFLRFCFAFVFVLLVFNISKQRSYIESLGDPLSISDIEALANGEEGNSKDCSGGSCTSTDKSGFKCSACCPQGKIPRCDSYECYCGI